MSANEYSVSPQSRPVLWRNVLFFAGSAMFGGLAVALWNRRELMQIQRERLNPTLPPAQAAAHSEEEII